MPPSEQPAVIVDRLLRQILASSGLDLTYTCKAGKVLEVEFSGPDTPRLLAHRAELLLALEHVAAKALRLEPEEHDRVSFDAGNFKAERHRALSRMAASAVAEVRRTGRPFHFAAMNSRERRMLHLELQPSGLSTQSEGEGPQRHLVLRPARRS